ncbi:MAG: hypothetical protein HWD61_03105 [Parachlamydiaceae bacterium]|nr:MAG: hypothetical protein HWD61_03105 [Parachlamydiaceae bacterium]
MNDIEWHFYDQNLFSYLATHPSPIETVKFVKTLNEVLSVDLFDNDFHVISTPITFLEAIGITSFPKVWNEIPSNLNIDKQNIQELPSKLVKFYNDLFLEEY